LYGPGARPKTKLPPTNPDGAQKINNEGKQGDWRTIQSILEEASKLTANRA